LSRFSALGDQLADPLPIDEAIIDEGIVAKRLADPYDTRARWLKIKNPDYSQKEGRGDLFNSLPLGRTGGTRQRHAHPAGWR
jgi:hypothetical protein